MARKPSAQAAALMEAERADREENANINEAIARTDSEVFTDAIGDEPLDDEAGTELEDMGEGLEGEELEDEDEEAPEGEQQAQPEGEQEAQGEEEEGEQDEPAEGAVEGEPPTAVEQQPRPSIPPRVLAAQRERYQAQNEELRTQLRDMQMRIDNLSRQPAPQPQPTTAQPPQQAPDMFADPDGYRNWVLSEAERRADARFNDRFGQMQQQQQRDMEMRLNDSLAQTASGPKSYEFNVAYRDLTSLDKTPENSALVRRIVQQPDPGQAILDWWEKSSNPEYIEYHRDQIRQAYGVAARPSRGGPQRQNGRLQNGQVPRHEVRLPRSLSEASGGRSQHVSDPEMMDGAEESIFAYGARR